MNLENLDGENIKNKAGQKSKMQILDSFGRNIAPDPTGLYGVMGNRSIPKWKWASSLQAEADLARAKNYLEGLDFILDMYFNSIESPPNYFWYYKYTKAPTLDEISNYLISNEISSHKENLPSDFDYLTREEYKSYMNCSCDKNINEIKRIYGKIL
jgi:hypothetical protein